jgi:hypothetical protein
MTIGGMYTKEIKETHPGLRCPWLHTTSATHLFRILYFRQFEDNSHILVTAISAPYCDTPEPQICALQAVTLIAMYQFWMHQFYAMELCSSTLVACHLVWTLFLHFRRPRSAQPLARSKQCSSIDILLEADYDLI